MHDSDSRRTHQDPPCRTAHGHRPNGRRPWYPACQWTRTFPDTKRRHARHRGSTTSEAHVREVHMTEQSRADRRAHPAVAPLIDTTTGASEAPDAEPHDAEIT